VFCYVFCGHFTSCLEIDVPTPSLCHKRDYKLNCLVSLGKCSKLCSFILWIFRTVFKSVKLSTASHYKCHIKYVYIIRYANNRIRVWGRWEDLALLSGKSSDVVCCTSYHQCGKSAVFED
jgi:hypothetical protein